jgi:signal transduction histidine kinase
MKKRLSPYWWCQIIGWNAFSIFTTTFYISAGLFIWQVFPILALMGLLSIFITHAMRLFIIKAGLLELSVLRQIICLFLTIIIFSFVLSAIINWLARILGWGKELLNVYSSLYKINTLWVITYSNCFFLGIWNLIYFSHHYIRKSQKEQVDKICFENELKIQRLKSEKIRLEMQQQAATLEIKAMVATQEQERKRISRDLHDDVGTKLSALKLFLSSLREKASVVNNEEIRSLAESSEQFIKEAIQDVRQLLLNLSPAILEEFGYTTAVEVLVNKINEAKQIHFTLIVFGMKQRLPKDYELALYRITQELVNNVLKHAEAKNVALQIGYRDEKIILMIEDDGKGFDVNTHKDGYGLHNLDARTKLMQGTMTIDSKAGKGTSVLIEIPYNFNGI